MKRSLAGVISTVILGTISILSLSGCNCDGGSSNPIMNCETQKEREARAEDLWESSYANGKAQEEILQPPPAATVVEEYTEEPRWEGATDYSQSCSSSSGDLNCENIE